MVLFISPSPLRTATGCSKPPCCPARVTRILPAMAKKRPSSGSKAKSKSNAPKRARSANTSPKSKSTMDLAKATDDQDNTAEFIPRGPTLRKEYERKGLIEPTMSPDAGILPEVVSNRMIRRILFFGGVPLSFLFSFFAVYFVLKYKYDITVIPVVVAFSTLGTVAMATGGITYGIFSSSWDIEDEGSWLGWKEAKVNAVRAKDGLVGARQREKEEDELDRIDRMGKADKKDSN